MSKFLNKKLVISAIAAVVATTGMSFAENYGNATFAIESVAEIAPASIAKNENEQVLSKKEEAAKDEAKVEETVEKVEEKSKEVDLKNGKVEEKSKEVDLENGKVEEKSKEVDLKNGKVEEKSKEVDLKDEKVEEKSKEVDLKDEKVEEKSNTDVATDKQVSNDKDKLERINNLKDSLGNLSQNIEKIKQDQANAAQDQNDLVFSGDDFSLSLEMLNKISIMKVENPNFANFFENNTLVIEKANLWSPLGMLYIGALLKSDANLPEDLVLEVIDPETNKAVLEAPAEVINLAEIFFSNVENVDSKIFEAFNRPILNTIAFYDSNHDPLKNNKNYTLNLVDKKNKALVAQLNLKTDFRNALDVLKSEDIDAFNELSKNFSSNEKSNGDEPVKLVQESEVTSLEETPASVN